MKLLANIALFIIRFLMHTITFMFVMLPLMLIGVIILLFVCPFMANDRLQLPTLFRWWDIVDSYVGRDTSVIRAIYAKGWWARYCYIAWRNPINYFDYMKCGLDWNGHEVYTLYNPADDDVGDGTRPGFRHIEVSQYNTCICAYRHTSYFYEYYWIYVYPFKKDVCFRFRLGWKIGDNKNKPNTISQWVFVISPWHNYTGKPV